MVRAVGFKLLDTQARSGKESAVWTALTSNKNLHIILLTRGNHLARLVSIKQGLMTGHWDSRRGSHEIPVKIRLDPAECEFFFDQSEKNIEQQRQRFRNHPRLEIEYEQLANNKQDVISQVDKFLGVEHYNVETTLNKQNPYPLHECIVNYSDLQAQFRHSHWRALFEDH
jgi:hypothetical protein